MKFLDKVLPWTGKPVRKVEDLQDCLVARLRPGSGRYLPRSITLFVDPEVEEAAVQSFFDEMALWLGPELARRQARRDIFVRLGLFSPEEIESFMTIRTGAQPWAIYYSASGGLGIPAENGAAASFARRGVVPCSSMRNHGVAWTRDHATGLHVWLATARKEGQGWDWDSDIGHESAHAAFAQVPLFTQLLADAIDKSSLADVKGVQDLSPAHIARMAYFYSEIAVVAVRGECRPTQSGLPVAEREELRSVLELSNQLAPKAGFRQALAAYAHVQGM
jgi:hypothetical protein